MLLKEKKEIEAWLNEYRIINYKLVPNEEYGYVVNVNGDVILSYKYIDEIKVKFNEIKGNFLIDNNELNSLEGCPEIVNGDFFCNCNKLTSLKYSPKTVKSYYDCCFNSLTSLEGCPSIIYNSLNCNFNYLVSLKGCPEIINNNFYCSYNYLIIEELKYLPKEVKNNIINIKNNFELNDLQYIENFEELKDKISALLEKNNLSKIIKEFDFDKKMNIQKI